MKPDAMIVIDVQTALIEAHPYREEAFLGTLQTLLTACRRHGVPVIYIQHEEAGSELEHGTAGWRIAQAVAPAPGEKVFAKRFNSSFRQTGLHEHLQSMGAKRLILCGMQTEYCVDTTVKVAFELGYEVSVPEGGTDTFDNGSFKSEDLLAYYQRRIWHNELATVTPVETLLLAIEG